MPKLTCVKCNIDLRVEENGVKVVELMNNDTQVYQIWDADMWKCPICEVEIVGGFAQHPFFEHWQGEGQELIAKMRQNGAHIIFCKEHLYTALPRL